MSIYTPPPPDHFAVLEGVNHFQKSTPEGVPAYADIHTWSRSWSEDVGSDPQFLEADIKALADVVAQALDHLQQKVLNKDLRIEKSRARRPVRPALPAVDVR